MSSMEHAYRSLQIRLKVPHFARVFGSRSRCYPLKNRSAAAHATRVWNRHALVLCCSRAMKRASTASSASASARDKFALTVVADDEATY